MPRGSVPAWRQRKPPVLDSWILASISQAGGKFDPETGRYATLCITGLASREEAKEYVKGLHRAGVYLTRYAIADVGVHPKINHNAGGYSITFAAVDKAMARKHIIDTYGPDRSRWPYDPRRRNHGN